MGVFADKSMINGIVDISNNSSLDNPLSVFFGKMDYLFNVGFVLSLFAFMFTFAGVSGEKEHGTLKLIMSNEVSRWVLPLAKITGNFIVFVLPFLVAFVVGVLVLSLSGVFPLTGPGIGSAIIGMFAISVLFLLCMLTLGIMISSSSRNSMAANITLLFIWAVIALVIPKLSPMVAQKIHPVQSEEVVMQQVRIVRNDVESELSDREDELFVQYLGRYGLTQDEFYRMETREGKTEERQRFEDDYESAVTPIREEYANRLTDETARLQRSYANELAIQQGIAIQLSRLSPISCFMYVLSSIASTGPEEADNFARQAEQFQEQVTSELYNKFTYRKYGSDGHYNVGFYANEAVDNLPVPQMAGYRFAALAEAFGESWPDFLLLALYTVLFFAGAFVKFIRYDVR